MSAKTINTRTVQKHETESDWLKAVNFVPLQSEFIVYDADETHSYARFKIGDGKTPVNDLPFCCDLGDIETALDGIIAIQNELIGGESA